MFKIGEEVVCVNDRSSVWYNLGDKHIVRGSPFKAYCEDKEGYYDAYHVEAFYADSVWIDSTDFLPTVKIVQTAPNYAAAFNAWMNDYTNNPQAFEDSHTTAIRHLTEKLNGEVPSYGAVCAELFQEYLNKTRESK